jgi:hypothetical protein
LLEQHIETWFGLPADRQSLARAEEFLLDCFFVGVTERLQASINILEDRLKIVGPPPILNLNPDPAGPHREFSDAELRVLADLNKLDLELYDLGTAILDRDGPKDESAI